MEIRKFIYLSLSLLDFHFGRTVAFGRSWWTELVFEFPDVHVFFEIFVAAVFEDALQSAEIVYLHLDEFDPVAELNPILSILSALPYIFMPIFI